MAQAQTVHIDKGKIAYKETVKVKDISKTMIYDRAKDALDKYVKKNTDEKNGTNSENGKLETRN